MKNYNLRTNHKTFPIHVSIDSVNSLKSCPGQESVTLLIKRRNTLRQKSLFRLLYKSNKKTLLFVILVCMTLLIIYANSDRFFRKPIFSIFLLQDKMHAHDKDETQLNDYESSKSSVISASECLKTSHILVNSTFVTDIGDQVFISKYNIFVIYTKDNYHLHMKFELFIHSLLKHTNAQLHLHIITDKKSEVSVLSVLQSQVQQFHRTLEFTFYDVNVCSSKINDIIDTLSTYFSSSPNSYYSDSIFFLSLGLHRITEPYMDRAVLLDCDIVFRSDVRLLFKEFERFLPHQLFGLAPELTPVYRHILYRYRIKNPKTNFGNPYYLVNKENSGRKEKSLTPAYTRHGYPGLNSGVVLLNLKRIRHSKVYEQKLTKFEVHRLVTKYDFKGHLGDQDLFTLLGFEYPNLIYRLDCVWNRQLCTWWKDHGYSDIFDAYFHCEGVIQMYHGNCNTRIPE